MVTSRPPYYSSTLSSPISNDDFRIISPWSAANALLVAVSELHGNSFTFLHPGSWWHLPLLQLLGSLLPHHWRINVFLCNYAVTNVLICGSQPPASLGISCLFDLGLAVEHLSNILPAPSTLPCPMLNLDLLLHLLLCYEFLGVVGVL